MQMHNFEMKMVWVATTTDFLPNGNKKLIFDFITPPFGVSK
jgi:hypothetical protein